MIYFKSQVTEYFAALRKWRGKAEAFDSHRGFTLIEILVVFSIMGILATGSVVSFVRYNETQTVANASRDIRQMISNAKSRAQSQVKPVECAGRSLDGYEVKVCANPTNCTLSQGNYEMAAVCSGLRYLVDPKPNTSPKLLPSRVSLRQTQPQTVFFKILSGGVIGSGNIILEGYGQTRTVIVDTSGNVYEE